MTAVDISPDGLTVICGTANCTLGILDMTNNAYKTLLRSHVDMIVDIDVHDKTG